MGKNYRQLSIEERTMIQTQLQMGIKPAAIAQGFWSPESWPPPERPLSDGEMQ